MAGEAHNTFSCGDTILLPLAAIRRTPQPWHTRIVVPDSAIERLARAIRATGRVIPITVIHVAPGTYGYVAGLIRVLALERLGHTHVPAHVLDAADEEMLLLVAISEQEAQVAHAAGAGVGAAAAALHAVVLFGEHIRGCACWVRSRVRARRHVTRRGSYLRSTSGAEQTRTEQNRSERGARAPIPSRAIRATYRREWATGIESS
jgi:hypothetical protein